MKDLKNMLYKHFTPLENYYNFDESYDPISVYMGYFRELPNIKYLPGVDPEKSLKWIMGNLSDQFHCEHKQEKYTSIRKGRIYGASLFIFRNRLMISKELDSIRIYYPPALESVAELWVEGLMRFPVVKKRNSEISLVTTYKHGLDTTKIDLKRLLVHHPHILKSLRSTDTCGLFLFHGEPGTGKSTYIRFLIHQLKKKVILITAQVAQNLDSPGMTMLLMENRNSVFVIEDAEELLVSRNLQTQSGISMLLNLSDGILGESLGIQIIATFNTSLHNIDPALLRKGRLKMRYEFKSLSIEKSRSLLLKLGKFDYQVTQPMTLAEIYHSGENDYKWQEQKNRIGFK
jgi:ATPase family associated with various cellular activities (AAA)